MSKIVIQLQITPDGFCNHADVIADEKHLDFVFQQLDEPYALPQESGVIILRYHHQF